MGPFSGGSDGDIQAYRVLGPERKPKLHAVRTSAMGSRLRKGFPFWVYGSDFQGEASQFRI